MAPLAKEHPVAVGVMVPAWGRGRAAFGEPFVAGHPSWKDQAAAVVACPEHSWAVVVPAVVRACIP